MKQQNSAFSVAALILGIIAAVLFFTCCFSFISFIPAIAGIICALIAKSRTERWSGMAIAGFVCSVVTAILFLVFFVVGVYIYSMDPSNPSSIIEQFQEDGGNSNGAI